jgi:transketolase
VIVDVNKFGQSQETMHAHNINAYIEKFKAFGWETIAIDGHNINEILNAFKKARESNKPCAIIAKTIKGKGVSFLEDKDGWHGKPLDKEQLEKALQELGKISEIDAKNFVNTPYETKKPDFSMKFDIEITTYSKESKIATRKAYGNALVSLGKINNKIIVIDGDVKNSTMTEAFFNHFPERSFESYIAEQNMIGMTVGFSAKGFLPFTATFAAFLTRAYDFIRMASYSNSNIKIAGSHVGVSIGQDGPSQMGLEDIAMFRAIPMSIILYPCDGISTEHLLKISAEYVGISYLRTTRSDTPIIYNKDDKFELGGSKVLKKSDNDKVTIVAAGITVHEALKAYDELKKQGINIRVIDAYSIKPIDKKNINKAVNETANKLIVVEDHYECGGLGDAVISALAGTAKFDFVHLCIREPPRSGKPEELLDKYGISTRCIIDAVKVLVKN